MEKTGFKNILAPSIQTLHRECQCKHWLYFLKKGDLRNLLLFFYVLLLILVFRVGLVVAAEDPFFTVNHVTIHQVCI